MFFLANNSRYLNGFFCQKLGLKHTHTHSVRVDKTQKWHCLFRHFFDKRKTYVAKLVFPTKQMKLRKAGKLYNNEFNFEAKTHTHTDLFGSATGMSEVQ